MVTREAFKYAFKFTWMIVYEAWVLICDRIKKENFCPVI